MQTAVMLPSRFSLSRYLFARTIYSSPLLLSVRGASPHLMTALPHNIDFYNSHRIESAIFAPHLYTIIRFPFDQLIIIGFFSAFYYFLSHPVSNVGILACYVTIFFMVMMMIDGRFPFCKLHASRDDDTSSPTIPKATCSPCSICIYIIGGDTITLFCCLFSLECHTK